MCTVKPVDPLLAAAFAVLAAIRARGHLAVVAGGAVRDHVLGRPLTDADIATDMPLAELASLFRTHAVGRSQQFETVVLVHRGRAFEVTRFRGGGGRPGAAPPEGAAGLDAATLATLREDTARRDFTINALLMDHEGRVIDLQGGLADLRARVVRAVGDPAGRFAEDPARLLRAVRFAACLGFEIEERTAAAIRGMAPRLAGVAAERIGAEILKLAAAPGTALARGVEQLDELGLLRAVLPEVADLRGLEHKPEKHPEGGVWEHTLVALRASFSTDPAVNLAVLLHDVGKRPVLAAGEARLLYHGHETAGAALVAALARRLALPQRLRETLVFAVDNHRRAGKIAGLRRSQRLALLGSDHWPVLRALALCDRAARGDVATVARLEAQLAEAERDAAAGGRAGAPVVSGTRIMELTGLAPGPRVGEIQRLVSEWALDNTVVDGTQIEQEVLRTLRSLAGEGQR